MLRQLVSGRNPKVCHFLPNSLHFHSLPDDDWRERHPSFQEAKLSEHLAFIESLRVVGATHGVHPEQADGVMNAGTLRLTSHEKAEIEALNELTV